MKKEQYMHIIENKFRSNLIMFIQTLQEVLFEYSFESYKLPALNGHYLCYDILTTKENIDNKSILEGNFIPLAEEFEEMIERDIVLRDALQVTDVVLKKRDKLDVIVDYRKGDNKTKIKKYAEAAEYILALADVQSMYLSSIYDLLIMSIFHKSPTYSNYEKIYSLTRTLATELVNDGYSKEYISQELKNMFLNPSKLVKVEEEELIDFFNHFTFEKKKYSVKFGVNAAAASFLSYINLVNVEKPTDELVKALNLKHKGDRIVEIQVEEIDEYKACESAQDKMNTIVSLHRISQHHKPVYINGYAQIYEVDENGNILSDKTIKTTKNILLQANNDTKLQSYFFDDQLLNSVQSPEAFFRAVSLHNTALDSKEETNQLLSLWTAIETLVAFRSGDEDKINVVCDILGGILNRTYLYSQIKQLYKDISTVLEQKAIDILNNVSGEEKEVIKLAKLLILKTEYDNLYGELNEYPLLQYRMEKYAYNVFKDSESIYLELKRHRKKIKWQVMRIYRNRNMIVHDGKHMPYLDIILGNLHYYVDSMLDVLIEYYHLGIKNNKMIFMDIGKDEINYWGILGLDDKGKKIEKMELNEENFLQYAFNNYQGNVVKNALQYAYEEYVKTQGNNKLE